MNLGKGLEEQAVLSHSVLDPGLEHDAAGQRADDHDDGHDGHNRTGVIADEGDLGGQQGDGCVGGSQLIHGQQAGSNGGQTGVQSQNDEGGQNQTTGQVFLGILDLTGHIAGGAHAVKGPGSSGDTGQQSHDAAGTGEAGQRRAGQEVVALDEERADADDQGEGQNLQRGDDGLELAAALNGAQMHKHEYQHEGHSDEFQDQAVNGNEEGQVIHDGQSHDGDGGRIGGPEADPAAQEGQRTGTGFPEVDVLTAILGIGGGQLRVAEVCRNLEQAADDEGQHQEQAAAGSARYLRQGREDAGTDSGADAQRQNGAQAQFSTEIGLFRGIL